MKKLVQIVSFSAVLCLCCCFSTFGSVKASALDKFYNQVSPDEAPINMYYSGGSFGSSVIPNAYGWYEFENSAYSNNLYLNAIFYSTWDIVFDSENFDYYFNLMYESDSSDSFTFFPASARLTEVGLNGDSIVYNIPSSDISFHNYSGRTNGVNTKGFTVLGKMPDGFQGSIRSFYVANTSSGSIPSDLRFTCTIIQVAKDASSEYVQGIVAAINNQTSALGGKLDGIDSSVDQAADDIQQSIEDQYQMEDEEDFGFSDIQEQYEEKMGVLTFGTETTLQMLDLFSPSNAGEAYIRVPGFSIDVQGESYRVWDDYVFRFAWIEEWIPLLVRLMRTFNVTMFYIAILSYINKVYERNFLAK